jgi:hypothetical protein
MSQGRLEECGKEVKRAAKMNGAEYPEDLLQPKEVSGCTYNCGVDGETHIVLIL